jgi:hypothetical protein
VKDIYDLMFYFLLGILNEHHLLGYAYNKCGQVIAGDIGEGDLKLYGNNDGLVPYESAVFDGIPGLYVEILNYCDHLSLVDNGGVINTVTAKLIEIANAAPSGF